MRLSRCEVRDHMNYRKNDRWLSYQLYRALQRLKSRMRYVFEIFGAPRFSTFSTISAITRHPPRKRLMNDAFLMAPHYHHSKQTDFADRGCVVASSVQTHTQCPLSTSVLIGSTRA